MDISAETRSIVTHYHIDALVREAAGHVDSSYTWSCHSTGTVVELLGARRRYQRHPITRRRI